MLYYYIKDHEWITVGEHIDNWAFSLIIDEFPNLQAWKEAFRVRGAVITDESNTIISPDDMEAIITFREGNIVLARDYISKYGDRVFQGPHNLVCARVGETFGDLKCIANEGCWDLCVKVACVEEA